MRVMRLITAICLGLGLTLILQWILSLEPVPVVQAASSTRPLHTPINLVITKTVNPNANVAAGDLVTYTVILTNSGTTSDTNTIFTDTLPPDVDFVTWVEQPAGAGVSNDEITWNGTVTGNTAITFTFAVIQYGAQGQIVTNTAQFSGTTQTGTATTTFTVNNPNDGPAVGTQQVLYDGSLGTTVDAQGEFTYVKFPFGGSSDRVVGSGVTTLTTTVGDYTGFFHGYLFPPTNQADLNRSNGYSLRFSAQVVSESRNSSAEKNNDGVDDRAGFSVIIISSDGTRGIELGFWENRIWAQEDGEAEPTGPRYNDTLFTQSEGASFDTTAGLIDYELIVYDYSYSLLANGSQILSGRLRDYSALSGFPDPYQSPNFIFFGDDTPTARATVMLGDIEVVNNTTPANKSTDNVTPLIIDDIRVMDIDAGGDDVVLTITVNSGTLTISDGVPNGLTAGQISGNGTGQVVLTAPFGTINTTLAFSPSLTYTANIGFGGVDTATATINDQGHNGTGSALSDTKTFQINVSAVAVDLVINKTVTPITAAPGDMITYTLTFSNAGAGTATGIVITDEIPLTVTHGTLAVSSNVSITATGGVSFAWAVQDLAFADGGIITLTGILSDPLVAGTFTNTARITATLVDGDTTNNTASVGLQVSGWVINEINADPAGSIAGDANGDGVRDAGDDEFVELINNTGGSVDISGWTLTDITGPAFVFPSGTVVPPGCGVVVFGGGAPTGSFGGAFVFAGSGGVGGGLNNSGDTVTLNDGSQDIISYSYGNEGNHDESLTRSPDVTGADPLVRHNTQTSASTLYSPGTQLDGTAFAANCTQADLSLTKTVASTSGAPGQTIITYTLTYTNIGPDPATGIVITDELPISLTNVAYSSGKALITPTGGITYAWTVQNLAAGESGLITITGQISSETASTLTNAAEITTTSVDTATINNTASVGLQVSGWVINEIHADPDSLIAGDANGDGTRHASQDEFVELINNSGADVDISGWTVGDNVSTSFAFPSGTVVPQGCAVVIFGGGTSTGDFGGAFVFTDNGTIGNGLANTGDTVILTDGSQTVVTYTYGNEGNHDESLTLSPDVTGPDPLVRHNTQTSASTLYSPGTKIDGSVFATGCTQADLSLTKAVTPISVSPGETITYTLTFTNNGPYPAPGVVITDILPITLTNVAYSSNVLVAPTGSISNAWQVQNLEPGESGQITITGQISSVVGSHTFTNSATITSLSVDSPAGNNEASVGVIIVTPEIVVLGNSQIITNGDTTPSVADDTDFGTAIAAVDAVTHTFTVSNRGTANLVLSGIPRVELSGPTSGGFSVTSQPDNPIAANATTPFTITFTPAGTGLFTATVTITNSDSAENPYTFVISGTGTLPQTDLQVSKNRLGSGTVTAGEAITYTLTLTNNGPSTLNTTVTDTFTGSITAISDQVSAGGTCANAGISPVVCNFVNFTGTQVITLVMTTNPTYSGTLTNTAQIGFGAGVTVVDPITTNDSSTVTATVVAYPEMAVLGNGQVITNSSTIPSTTNHTDFGTTFVNTPVVRTFTISNSGAGDLNLASVNLSSSSFFSVTTSPGTPVGSNSTETFSITYNPTAAGSHTAIVSIANNDFNENPYTFVISGTGTSTTANCFTSLGSTTDYSSADAQALRDAVAAALPGGTVKVAGYCAGVLSGQVVTITKNITVTGGYATSDWNDYQPGVYTPIIDALGGGRVLYVDGTFNLLLKNLYLTNGFVAGNGAGIYANNAALAISNSIVISNVASSGGYGGGLQTNMPVALTNTQFISNTAGTSGGAINADGLNVSVTGGLFQNNRVTGNSGGALRAETSGVNIDISNAQFIKNTAAFYGGAIIANGLLTVSNTQFITNTANVYGGAIYSNQPLTLSSSQFISNTARQGGGAIFSNSAITDTLGYFADNVGTNFCGAIRTSSTGNLQSTQLINNSTGGPGGATCIDGGLTATNIQVLSNTATTSGGGLYNGNTNHLTNVLLQNNRSLNQGGGLFINGGNAYLTNTQVISNLAVGDGGGIYNDDGTVTLNGSSQVSNNTALFGAGIYNGAGSNGATVVMNSNTRIAGNTAITDGGGIYNTGGDVFVDDGQFIGNQAGGAGGGVWIISGTLTITDTTFSNNQANNGGGVGSSGGSAMLVNVTVSGNTATAQGGGLYNNGGTVSLTNTTVSSNTGVTGGGINSAAGTTILRNTIVANSLSGNDCSGTLTSNGYNLSGDTSCTGFIGTGDLTNINPQLGPLANNGGNTQTHALLTGSPAIDTGTCDLTTDQRGQTRPGTGSAFCDIGAYEASTVGADLALSKGVTPTLAAAGETITYTLTITNNGPNNTTGVVITDALPPGITFGGVVGSPSLGSYLPGTPGIWTITTLTNSLTATLRFTATVNGGTSGQTLTNTTGISSSNVADSNTGNNNASAGVTVSSFDLAITKSSLRNPGAIAVISYTVTVVNNSGTAAPGAVISDAIPAGVSDFSWNCVASGGASCPRDAAGNTAINETTGVFPVGGQLVYNITATLAISTATITNTATVTSLNGLGDSNPGNNSATDISNGMSNGSDIYLPILCKAGCVSAPAPLPDLIITSIIATGSDVVVVIKNQGFAPVNDAFWVDVYYNKTPAYNVAGDLYWGLSVPNGGVPIPANGEVTLSLSSPYHAGGSAPVAGTSVQGLVDSVGPFSYRAVQEISEGNNTFGPVSSAAILAEGSFEGSGANFDATGLPPRN